MTPKLDIEEKLLDRKQETIHSIIWWGIYVIRQDPTRRYFQTPEQKTEVRIQEIIVTAATHHRAIHQSRNESSLLIQHY
jgi:hypothetical protein